MAPPPIVPAAQSGSERQLVQRPRPTARGPRPTVSSSLVWLTPPMLRTNSITDGHHAGHLGGVVQRAARQARRLLAGEVREHARPRSRPAPRRRRPAPARTGGSTPPRCPPRRRCAATPRAPRRPSRRGPPRRTARWSSVSSQIPLNAVTMPGATATMPMVARVSPAPRASRGRPARSRAAVRKASRRRSIGVDPGVGVRAAEAPRRGAGGRRSPLTTPSGRSMRSSTGPCSMCSSR